MVNANSGLAKELGTSQQNLTDAAKAAIELDRVIARLEGREPDFPEEVLFPARTVFTFPNNPIQKFLILSYNSQVSHLLSPTVFDLLG